MSRCWQALQRSTCPPSAALRQRSIADITLSWPMLNRPPARKADPWARKMSATSRAQRPTEVALRGVQTLYGTDDLAQNVGGDLRIERRGLQFMDFSP